MNDFRIEPLNDNDIEQAILLCDEVFRGHHTMASDHFKMAFFTEPGVSCKAVLNGKMIGCYLINEDFIWKHDDFTMYEDIAKYAGKKSIHGVALALLPEYQGKGFGKLLRSLPCKPEKYDYVWGYQVKSLNNIDNWTRFGRRIVGESDTCYMTLMDLPRQLNINHSDNHLHHRFLAQTG